jgi:hypothetical protein
MNKMNKLVASAVAMLAVAFLVTPGVAGADIVDLFSFQSAVDAAQAIDPSIAAPPNDGGHDFAVGGGRTASDDLGFGFSAHSGPLGQDPQGHMSFGLSLAPPFPKVAQVTVDVTCLTVVGNVATIGGEFTHVNAPGGGPVPVVQEGGGGLFVVTDNGNPVNGQSLDQFAFVSVLNAPPTICPFFGAVAGPLANGNILVHDVLP